MNRRRFVALSAVTSASITGCLSLVSGSETHERRVQSTTSTLERPNQSDAVDEDVFSTYVNSMREHREYGETGIWGTAQERPTDAYAHVGALTETRHHDNDTVSNHALAVYALGDDETERQHQCWLWSGFDVSEADEALTGISIEFDALSDGITIGTYAPRQTVDADETGQYSLDIEDAGGGLSSAFPLRDGTVEVDDEGTEAGPGGSVRVRWTGTETERYALGTTFEATWDTEGTWDFSWTVTGTFS